MILSGQTYICSAFETFDSVALILYGDEKYAADLLNANPEHCRKPVFEGGEELRVPVVEISDTTAPTIAPWKKEG